MKGVIETLVQGLVDSPESVQIDEVSEDGGTVYEVSVADGDLGKVIGKDGKIANAWRQVARGLAGPEGRAHVEIRS